LEITLNIGKRKMKIIILSGPNRCGKTETMKLVYDNLISLGAIIVAKKTQAGASPRDFECVLEYQNKKIALYSMGDRAREIIKAIIRYKNYNPKINVLIICCNTRLKKPIPFARNNSNSLHIVNKNVNPKSNRSADDANKCAQIISLI